jgi:hypothetical protein
VEVGPGDEVRKVQWLRTSAPFPSFPLRRGTLA